MFKKFIAEFASLFNFRLPKLPFVVNPECAFSLSYTQKWVLEMASPFILLVALLAFVWIRTLAGIVAREALARFFPKWPHAVSDLQLETKIRNYGPWADDEEERKVKAEAKRKRHKHVVYEPMRCQCNAAGCTQLAKDWAPYVLLITGVGCLFLVIVYVMGAVSSKKTDDATKGKLLIAFVVGLVVLIVGAMLVCFRTKPNDSTIDAIEAPKTRTEETEEIHARLQQRKTKEKLIKYIREREVEEAKSLVGRAELLGASSVESGAADAVVDPGSHSEEREITLRVYNWKELGCAQTPLTVRAASCRQLFARLCVSDGLKEFLPEDTVSGAYIAVDIFYEFDGYGEGFWHPIDLDETLDDVFCFVDANAPSGVKVKIRPFSLEDMTWSEIKQRANALNINMESLGIEMKVNKGHDKDDEAVDEHSADDDGMRRSMRLSMSRNQRAETEKREHQRRQEEKGRLQKESEKQDELLRRADEPSRAGGIVTGCLCFGAGSLLAFMAADALPQQVASDYLKLWVPFLAAAASCTVVAVFSWYTSQIVVQQFATRETMLEQVLRTATAHQQSSGSDDGLDARNSRLQHVVELLWRGSKKYVTAAAIAGGVCGVASGLEIGHLLVDRPGKDGHLDETLLVSFVLLTGFVAAALGGLYAYQSTHRFVRRLAVIANFDTLARDDLLRKVRYMLLVYCQVGYVFIVSSALEPLSCIRDVDNRWYMAANPQTECEWCGDGGAAYNSETGELSYPYIAGASYVIASAYSFGIPSLFFYIMYSQRSILRKAEFTQNYGFLTSKTSEQFYWWECAIIVRKLMLSIVTKYSVDGTSGDGSIRQSLCNMAIMLVACVAHVYARPFAHTDANAAEMATLFATMLTLLVGMGTIKVRDDAGETIGDPADREAALAAGEATAFYIMLYLSMFALCTMTLVVIARRVGGVLQQVAMGSGRKFKTEFLPTDGWSVAALRRRAQLEGLAEEEIRRALDEERPKEALDRLLRDAYDEVPPAPGLPDEIAELINKNKLEAALHWFNEPLSTQEQDSEQESEQWSLTGSIRGSIRDMGLGKIFGARPRDEYKVSEEKIHELIRCIRRYKSFVDDNDFRQKPKFYGMFSETGYTGQEGDRRTGREAMYAWMEHEIGKRFNADIEALTDFVTNLEEKRKDQMWASVPSCVQSVIKKQFMTSNKDTAEELELVAVREPLHTDETEGEEADPRSWFANLTVERFCYLLKAVIVGDKKSEVAFLAKGHQIQFGLLLTGVYGFGLFIWIRSQLSLCCPSDLTFDQVQLLDKHAGRMDRFGAPMLGEHAQLTGCSRTPEQTCEATCELGYFPTTVLRRKSQARTRNELYTCEKSRVSNLGLISHDLFNYDVSPPFWNHTGLAKKSSGEWWDYPVDPGLGKNPSCEYVFQPMLHKDRYTCNSTLRPMGVAVLLTEMLCDLGTVCHRFLVRCRQLSCQTIGRCATTLTVRRPRPLPSRTSNVGSSWTQSLASSIASLSPWIGAKALLETASSANTRSSISQKQGGRRWTSRVTRAMTTVESRWVHVWISLGLARSTSQCTVNVKMSLDILALPSRLHATSHWDS